jgi:hypothetical protein
MKPTKIIRQIRTLPNIPGAAPDLISGILQVDAVVPAGLGSGPQPVVLKVGQKRSQFAHYDFRTPTFWLSMILEMTRAFPTR